MNALPVPSNCEAALGIHGCGGKLSFKPAEQHAALTMNLAGILAAFIMETFVERQGSRALVIAPPALHAVLRGLDQEHEHHKDNRHEDR